MIKKDTHSEKETYQLAYDMAQKAKPSEVYALIGDLGVGKTAFAKGFAAGLGIEEPITSPTFTIVCEYEGQMPLYHFDVYRIEDGEELFEIGFEEYLYGEGVCLIEWADRIIDDLPEETVVVRIEKDLDAGVDVRKISIGSVGEIL